MRIVSLQPVFLSRRWAGINIPVQPWRACLTRRGCLVAGHSFGLFLGETEVEDLFLVWSGLMWPVEREAIVMQCRRETC